MDRNTTDDGRSTNDNDCPLCASDKNPVEVAINNLRGRRNDDEFPKMLEVKRELNAYGFDMTLTALKRHCYQHIRFVPEGGERQ